MLNLQLKKRRFNMKKEVAKISKPRNPKIVVNPNLKEHGDDPFFVKKLKKPGKLLQSMDYRKN
jgi:hypothetical protein